METELYKVICNYTSSEEESLRMLGEIKVAIKVDAENKVKAYREAMKMPAMDFSTKRGKKQ